MRSATTYIAITAGILLACTVQAQAQTFPPPGVDMIPGRVDLVTEIYGAGTFPGEFFGDTVVSRSIPYPDTTGGGDEAIDTEILSMDLVGHVGLWPAELHLSALLRSLGKTTDTNPDPGDSFPAESFFDIFFEIDVFGAPMGDLSLHNDTALFMESMIEQIPPELGKTPFLAPPSALPVDLLDELGQPVGRVLAASHSPEPATMSLLALGAAGVLARRRRRRKST